MNATEATIQSEPERQHQDFWAVTDWGTVEKVTGFDCGPSYKGKIWWVPHLGYSMTLGTHIFPLADKKQALTRALAEQLKNRDEAASRAKALQTELASLLRFGPRSNRGER